MVVGGAEEAVAVEVAHQITTLAITAVPKKLVPSKLPRVVRLETGMAQKRIKIVTIEIVTVTIRFAKHQYPVLNLIFYRQKKTARRLKTHQTTKKLPKSPKK